MSPARRFARRLDDAHISMMARAEVHLRMRPWSFLGRVGALARSEASLDIGQAALVSPRLGQLAGAEAAYRGAIDMATPSVWARMPCRQRGLRSGRLRPFRRQRLFGWRWGLRRRRWPGTSIGPPAAQSRDGPRSTPPRLRSSPPRPAHALAPFAGGEPVGGDDDDAALDSWLSPALGTGPLPSLSGCPLSALALAALALAPPGRCRGWPAGRGRYRPRHRHPMEPRAGSDPVYRPARPWSPPAPGIC